MCFSATASFSASLVLAVVGVATLKKVKNQHTLPLALVPLLFAIQQFSEGVLWFALEGSVPFGPYWPLRIYVLFVGVIWPVLIPFSIRYAEPNSARRRRMIFPIIVGMGVATYMLYALSVHGVTAQIGQHCISYATPAYAGAYLIAAYVTAACAAFFLSSAKDIVVMGAVNIGAFLITFYFYRTYLTSTWCFFAAILSGLLYLHITRSHTSGARGWLKKAYCYVTSAR